MFNVNPDKAIRIGMFLMLFFFIIDLVPLIAFKCQEKEDTGGIRGSLEFIAANLRTDPIMDIQIIDRKATCPDNFKPLKLGFWHGTVAGCLCDNGDLLNTPCSIFNSDPSRCKTDIPSTSPVEIYELGGSIWCGKRAVLGVDYIKKAECPIGYRECYPGGCFVGDCPVTKVEIASKGQETNRFSNSKDKYLMLTRKQEGFPLVNIQITPNDIPCFNQDLYAENSSYKLSLEPKNGCDKYGFDDKFSFKFDSQSTFEAFTQNSFRYSVMNLPYFEEKSKETTCVLSWRTRMKTANHDRCLDLDEKLIQKSMKALDRSSPLIRAILNALIAHVVYLIILGLHRCCTTSTEFFAAYSRGNGMMGIAGLLMLVYWPVILEFFMKINYYQELVITKSYFEEYDSLECFGEAQGSAVIRDYLEILGKGEVNFLMFSGLCLSNGFAILVCIWHWMTQKNISQQNDNPSNPTRT